MEGIGIKIVNPVLIIHCIYTIMYVGYTLASGHCSVWDTITSLTALAFISTPTDALKRTTGGNSDTKTFQELVTVREVEENNQLEFFFIKIEMIADWRGRLLPVKNIFCTK